MVKGFILQCVFVTIVAAGTTNLSNAQSIYNINIDLELKDATLKQVITEITQKTDFSFAFNMAEMRKKKGRVTKSFKGESVGEILTYLSQSYKLNFKRINETIHIKASEEEQEIIPEKSVEVVDRVISGKVVDESGNSIPGVNVYVKDTNIGTLTDFEGNFKLMVPDDEEELVFSYVGFSTEVVNINNRTEVNVTLKEDISTLSEIVVVGYGTQKKKDLTGSIAHLDLKESQMAGTSTLVQALQGLAPGLNAKMGSGAGAAGGLSIRGKTSLSADDDPLIVVDGMIYYGNITDFNMNDIASIDVLKDASAAAVYGSRSANGVIAITTKQGTTEKPKFNFNMYYGVQSLSNTDRINVMDAEQYATRLVDYSYQQDLYDWYKTNPASADDRPVRPDITDRELVSTYLRTEEEKNNYLNGYEIDWVDEVLQEAPTQFYNLSVSGKSKKTRYYISTSYTDQEGIQKNDLFKRLTFLSKLETEITDWFSLEFNPQYIHRDYSGVSASLSEALEASPLGNKYDEDGNYPLYVAGESYNYHPLGYVNIDDNEIRDNIRLAFKGKFDIPKVEGLKYEINYQKNYYFSHTYRYYPTTVPDGAKNDGYGYKDQSTSSKSLINNLITYNKIFGDHRVNVTLLHSEEQLDGEGTVSTGYGFASDKLGYNSLEVAETQQINSSAYEEITRSFMGRVTYAFKDRYLLTGTIRRDGYSAFGTNKKWANFPSLSFGWVVSEESFLQTSNVINYLKLRLSYGVNGNQGIGRYNSQSIMSSTSTVFDGATAIGIYSGSLGNSELGWETTLTGNIGLDFEILNKRLSGSVDVYKSTTSDVLVERAIPRASGNSSVWTNIGGIENHGVEVSLSSINVQTKGFSWNSGFTFAINRNKITELYDDVTEDIGNGWFVGESFYAIYGYQSDGIWQESDLFNDQIYADYYPGQWKIVDQNGDGEITADDDRKIVGNTSPNYRFSLSNQFSYKNLSLSIFINSIQGGNGYYMASNTGSLVAGGTDSAYRLNRTAIRQYWTPDNPVNDAPGMYNNPKIAPSVYQDKSFIRLQDITLAYQLNLKSLEQIGIESPKVYVSGKNLHTWTKWSGWDPDVDNYVMRSVVVGLNVNF